MKMGCVEHNGTGNFGGQFAKGESSSAPKSHSRASRSTAQPQTGMKLSNPAEGGASQTASSLSSDQLFPLKMRHLLLYLIDGH